MSQRNTYKNILIRELMNIMKNDKSIFNEICSLVAEDNISNHYSLILFNDRFIYCLNETITNHRIVDKHIQEPILQYCIPFGFHLEQNYSIMEIERLLFEVI